ncbi:MAG: bifunctional folylpolyglutamate synthase/dihydrofolate synthase [Clostridia bacterium]|nr:bifunctional folylpolyglutamate synthase/dihydrofolate synthase [Clostridia bacterium]
MNYDEALNYIHGTLKFGSKLGLHNIGKLLELMGNPQDKLKFVHVAGTNGKGSTVAFISSMLMEAGYKVGVYTSPYIERFTERMKIGNNEIGQSELAELTEFVKAKTEIMVKMGENHPTEFEIVTAIAFLYFCKNSCDIVVLEVGLGGRFDATNIIKTPELAVITTINFDHTSILGNTLPEIAFEKAGIIKHGGDVLLYPQRQEVEKVFEAACKERGAILQKAEIYEAEITGFSSEGQSFNYKNYIGLRITLLGDHQVNNAVLAINAADMLNSKGFAISETSIRNGLANARWPGRLEVVSREPLFIVDGAHNAEGARVLSEALNKYFPEKRKIFIFGVMRDKDYKSLVEAVNPLAYKYITVTPENERALSAEELAIFIRSYCKNVMVSDTIEEAIKASLDISTPDDLVCAFGSLYYIGKVRKYFKDQNIY